MLETETIEICAIGNRCPVNIEEKVSNEIDNPNDKVKLNDGQEKASLGLPFVIKDFLMLDS